MTNNQAKEDIIFIKTKEISCDGGSVLGHPKIYLNLENKNEIICPYCSRKFIYKN